MGSLDRLNYREVPRGSPSIDNRNRGKGKEIAHSLKSNEAALRGGEEGPTSSRDGIVVRGRGPS